MGRFWGKTKVLGDPLRVAALPSGAYCLDLSLVFHRLVDLPAIRARLLRLMGSPFQTTTAAW